MHIAAGLKTHTQSPKVVSDEQDIASFYNHPPASMQPLLLSIHCGLLSFL
jgi:hypothetical protein